ncbi:MAG: methionine gamma-lyase family protein [Clostridia bacterium]|nr:methionine gamma-lyase family protein [Clostridia bacterium]
MNNTFGFSPRVLGLAARAEETARERFNAIDAVTEYNQQKVLAAFINNNVSEACFGASTGYGYGDRGRETLDRIVADSFGAEDALIRHSFTCGTHTLGVMLYALLRPGDTMLCVTGRPYDTICPVIGIAGEPGQGSLADLGVKYKEVALTADGKIDLEGVKDALCADKSIRVVYLQRSRGYSLRPSLSAREIGEAAETVKKYSSAVVAVDNCYGEFVQKYEPVALGADIMAGSLIKNPGGGIARSGGYIAGRKDLAELCAYRMTVPGLGREVGATLGNSRDLYMGFFNAPHVTGEALKTAVFAAAMAESLGFEPTPSVGEERYDIIQALKLGNEENLIAFCRGIQKGSPVDAFVTPEPWDMPGYPCKVIMAAGAFILGSSIELSADAPLREPYAVWMQGGLNYHSAKVGVMSAFEMLLKF